MKILKSTITEKTGWSRLGKVLRTNALLLFVAMTASTSVEAQYSNSLADQETRSSFPAQRNAMILQVQVVTGASGGTLESLQFSTNGTTNVANIESAKLYYTNAGGFNVALNPANQVGGTVTSPSGSFSFTNLNLFLSQGSHLFWLAYDVTSNAVLLDSLDAEFTQVTMNGNSFVPSVTSPAGKRAIRTYAAYPYCGRPAASPLNYQIGIGRLAINNAVYQQAIPVAGTTQVVDTPLFRIPRDINMPVSYSSGSVNPQSEAIYIDFDYDGIYNPATELIYNGNTNTASTTNTNITIGCDKTAGQRRMRIATDLQGFGITPCVGNGYGTTFDFMVEIVDLTSVTASFTGPDTLYRGQFGDFINTSTGVQFNYEWDYDNSGSVDATTANARFNYSSTGNYTVSMRTYRTICSNLITSTATKNVVVIDPTSVPSAEFIANRNITNATLTVTLKDLSTNGANKWHWKITPEIVNNRTAFIYANGTDSNSQNPQIIFAELGSYNIELYTENVIGFSNIIRKADYIRNIDAINMCNVTVVTDNEGFVADEGGVFSNYASYATTGKTCGMLIAPPCAAEVSLNFLDFDMNSFGINGCVFPNGMNQPGDNIKIYDGVDNNGIPLHAAIGFPNGITNRGGNLALLQLPPTVTAKSGKMYIEYFVNCAANGRGFVAEWNSTPRAVVAPIPSVVLPDTVYIDAPFLVENNTSGTVSRYEWDYDNDGFTDFTGSTPEVLYTTPGVKTFKVTAYNCESSNTFTKTIVVLAPTQRPSVDFAASRTAFIAGDKVRLIDLSSDGPNTWSWTITPSLGVSYENGSSSSRNPEVKFNRTGKYTIKLRASNSFGADSLTKVDFLEVFVYCDPNVINLSTDIGISRFKMANVDNTSSIGVTPYTKYSGQIIEVQKGQTYTVDIERNTNFNRINRKVWIDFNRNGSFDDAGEEVLVQPASSAKDFSGTIRIPKNTFSGTTVLRIGVNAEANTNLSCGPNLFGEYEDYTLNISNDNTPPVITLLGDNPYYIERGFTYSDPGVLALDNSDGDITSNVITNGSVNTSVVGEYTLRFDVVDSNGNAATTVLRRVVVQPDGSGPVITLNGADTIVVDVNTTYTDAGATSIDFVDGNLTSSIQVTGSVNTAVLGTYYITFNSSDLQGNASTKKRVVFVKDQIAPVQTLVGANPLVIDFGKPFADPGTTVTDNFYTGLVSTMVSNVNIRRIGTYQVSYQVTDPSGNSAAVITRTVEVKDLSAPKLTIVGGDTVILDVFSPYYEAGTQVSDNHTTGIQVQISGNVNTSVIGNYTLTYSATDSSGNQATARRVVRVLDREAPVITLKGSALVQIARFAGYNDPKVNITDNYDDQATLNSNLEILDSVQYDKEGLYQICYKVSDVSGNKAAMVCRLVNVGPADPNGLNPDNRSALVNVYPNPSKGIFTVSLEKNWSNTVYTVVTVTGQEVQNGTLTSGDNNIDLSQFEPGVYFLRISSPEGIAQVKLNLNR